MDDSGRGRIGRYRLAGRIATGGMAEVYLAVAGELSGFRTLFVIKRVLPQLASDPDFIRMFLDEARLATLLDHPNIARVIEIGRDRGDHFLAIEAVHGQALSAVLRRTRQPRPLLSHAEIAFIIAQAAQGLGYAHRLTDVAGRPLNVVHRDVSPQNLLVSFEGAVKVIDFGVARALGQVSRTRPGQLKGKLGYLSPEQAATGHVDSRSDQFSLGVVLWELLCGERLFARRSDAETLRAIVDEQIVPPSRIVAIPRALENIVMQALEKDPARRFASADRMALALDRFAFAAEGFDPTRIGRTMRHVFAAEHQRCKDRIAAALALDGEPRPWPNPDRTPTGERPIGPGSGVRTMVLSRPASSAVQIPLVVPIPPARPRAGVPALTPHEPRAAAISPNGDGPRVRKASAVVVMTALALSCIGVGTFAAARWWLRTATPPARGAPVGRTTGGIVIASARPPSFAPASLRDSPPRSGREGSAEGSAASSAPLDQPSSSIVPPLAAQPRPSEVATPATTRFRRPPRAASTRSSRYVRPSRGTAAHPGRPPLPSDCAIVVGTDPWSEVWIDGHTTNRYTPYWDVIPCGLHRLTFKRDDLGLARTITLTVHPHETVKRTLTLAR